MTIIILITKNFFYTIYNIILGDINIFLSNSRLKKNQRTFFLKNVNISKFNLNKLVAESSIILA